jgi:hypothetical protein
VLLPVLVPLSIDEVRSVEGKTVELVDVSADSLEPSLSEDDLSSREQRLFLSTSLNAWRSPLPLCNPNIDSGRYVSETYNSGIRCKRHARLKTNSDLQRR